MSTGAPNTPHMKMMMNQMLSAPNVRAIAKIINEPEAKARTAVATTLPVLIAALGQEAATGEGAAKLAAALDRDHDGSLLNELDNYIITGGDVTGGRKILKHVLGTRQAHIEQQLSKASGLSVQDMSNVMAGLAPVVMGALAADMREAGVGSRGLVDLLLGNNSPIGSLLGGGTQGGVTGGGGLTGAIGGAIGSALLGSLLGGGPGSSSSQQGGGDVLGSLLGGVLGGGSGAPASQQSSGGGDLMGALLGSVLGGGSLAGGQGSGGDALGGLLGGLLGGGDQPASAGTGGGFTNTGGSLSDLIAGMGGASGSDSGASLPKPSAQQPEAGPQGMLGSLLTGLLTGGASGAGGSAASGSSAGGSVSSGASGGTDLSDFIAGLGGKK